MTYLDAQSLVKGNTLYTEFKGALTEQYVCQQLITDCKLNPYYWSAQNSRGEIDFLTEKAGDIFGVIGQIIAKRAYANLKERLGISLQTCLKLSI